MNRIYPRFAALALAATFAVSGGTLAAFAAPASADIIVTGTPAATARVSYDDLNLASAAGQQRLEARIVSAADRLCSEPGVKGLEAQLDAIACRDAAIASATQQRAAPAQSSAIVLASGR